MDAQPLLQRVLAGLALAALLAAGGHCSWVIFTDRADFFSARPAARGEAESATRGEAESAARGEANASAP